MPVLIAEIDAFAAARALGTPLTRDILRGEPCLPVAKLLAGDRKRDMQRSVTIMRRDGTARHAHGLERKAAPEDQEHAASADVISPKARVAHQLLQPQHIAVEARRALEVVYIERRLKHAIKLGHRYHM